MSNYTTELRFICETLSGLDESRGYNSVNEIISGSRTKIFDFNYPIFDSAYKPTLETKILKHYYTREICAETYGRWKLFLDARLNEIMPRYNKLYESELLKFNPLYDADYNRTGNKDSETTLDDTVTNTTDMTSLQTDNRTSTNTLSGADTRVIDNEIGGSDVRTTENELGGSDTTVTNSEDGGDESIHRENVPKTDQWTYYSDTPQGGVDGMNLEDDMYLTNATHVTVDATGSEDDSTTTFGKTVDTTGTTTYGKTSDTTDTTVYGKTNDTTDTLTYGKKSTVKDTGTTQTDTDGTTTSDRDSSENTSVDYAEHVIGKFPGKSYSKLLQEFRETFLNIDLMIINELSDLFFGLWE